MIKLLLPLKLKKYFDKTRIEFDECENGNLENEKIFFFEQIYLNFMSQKNNSLSINFKKGGYYEYRRCYKTK